jgi:protein-S-isoprenylcysteine O-methyltransferase Ste14
MSLTRCKEFVIVVLLMPETVRISLLAIGFIFLSVGGYYRIQSQRSGERLDRTSEGWPILIGIRLLGLATLGSTLFWFWKPELFRWASLPTSNGIRWIGVAGFACAVAWLLWMFKALGSNLTDTVVVRQDAHFVENGPYRFVRNPMYCGVLGMAISLGFALGTWLLPVTGTALFTLFAVRTRTEEKYLIERFGDQYRDYMRRVGRFLAKLLV